MPITTVFPHAGPPPDPLAAGRREEGDGGRRDERPPGGPSHGAFGSIGFPVTTRPSGTARPRLPPAGSDPSLPPPGRRRGGPWRFGPGSPRSPHPAVPRGP